MIKTVSALSQRSLRPRRFLVVRPGQRDPMIKTVSALSRRSLRPPRFLLSGRYSVNQDPTQRTTQKPQNTPSLCRGFFCEFSGFSVDRRRSAVTESARTGYQASTERARIRAVRFSRTRGPGDGWCPGTTRAESFLPDCERRVKGKVI